MTGGINNSTTNNGNIYNFYFNFGNSVDATNALNTINRSPYFQGIQDSVGYDGNQWAGQIPGPGSIPQPSINLSAPPAGRGLATGEPGWPENTTTTAGGYHIVANGNSQVSIYAPGQKVGDKAYAEWDGDPHFHGAGGVNVDFSGGKGVDGKERGQDFVLGDGTRIFAQVGDGGHPVTTGLTIQNGMDRVDVTGVNGKPQTGAIQQDGYEWRAQHVVSGSEGDRSTWYLRGDTNKIDIIQQSHGRVDGLVTGSHDVNGTYVSNIDSNIKYAGLGPGMRPPVGSRAWGNQLRDEIDDAQANYASHFGGAGIWGATQASYAIHENAIEGQFGSDLRQLYQQYGGWPSYFQNSDSAWQTLGMWRDLLLSDNQYQRELQFGRYTNFV